MPGWKGAGGALACGSLSLRPSVGDAGPKRVLTIAARANVFQQRLESRLSLEIAIAVDDDLEAVIERDNLGRQPNRDFAPASRLNRDAVGSERVGFGLRRNRFFCGHGILA